MKSHKRNMTTNPFASCLHLHDDRISGNGTSKGPLLFIHAISGRK